MKNKVFSIAMLIFLSCSLINAQVTPPEPPTPPVAPEVQPIPKIVDTTRFNLGNKQILIIDSKSQNSNSEIDEELEESMKDIKIEIEEHKRELDNAKREQERKLGKGSHGENKAPDKDHSKKMDKKKSSANVGFLDFNLGFNILNFGNSIPESTQDDLKIKSWGSWSYTFTFLPTKIYLGSPNFMLMNGFGWRIGQFEFKEKIDFVPKQSLVYTKNDQIKKSQFVIHQLQIPLGFYVQSNKIKGLGKIGIGLGGYAGLLIHQELETKTEDPKRSIETEEDFGFEDFRYGLSAQVDIGAIKLFANMDMNKLWKDNDIKNIECGIWFDF